MGTAYLRRKIKKGQAYTELFVDEMNDFYKTGFRVHDAHKLDDFTLRLKLYCTVCDFPGPIIQLLVFFSFALFGSVVQACVECTGSANKAVLGFAFAAGTERSTLALIAWCAGRRFMVDLVGGVCVYRLGWVGEEGGTGKGGGGAQGA